MFKTRVLTHGTGLGAPAVATGYMFLLAGFVVLATAEWTWRTSDAAGLGLASGPWLMGLWIILYRRGVTFEARAGRFSVWRRHFLFKRSTVRPLKLLVEVRLGLDEMRIARRHDVQVWPLSVLVHDEDEGEIEIAVKVFRDRHRAREAAEAIAELAGIALADETTGEVQQAEEAGLGYKGRMELAGGPGELPPPPENARARYEVFEDGVRIHIPPIGFTKTHAMTLVGGALMAFVIGGVAWLKDRAKESAGADWITLTIIVAITALAYLYWAVLAVLRAATRKATLEVSAGVFSVRVKGFLHRRRLDTPIDELKEFGIVDADKLGENASGSWLLAGDAILARSRKTSVAFGHGLPEEELGWIAAVADRFLTR